MITPAQKVAISKRVEEANVLINKANKKGLDVTDRAGSWQSPQRFNPLKFSRGVLFVSWQELDLYNYAKTGKTNFKKGSEKWGTSGRYNREDIGDLKKEITRIIRMYKEALRYY